MKATTFALLSLVTGFATAAAHTEDRVPVGRHFDPGATPAMEAARRYIDVRDDRGGPSYGYSDRSRREAPRGYWRDVTVKTWIPERWVMTRNRWGRAVRIFEPGYFTCSTSRMWVDATRNSPAHAWSR